MSGGRELLNTLEKPGSLCDANLLRSVVELSPMAMAVFVGADYRFALANRAYCQLRRLREDEVLGRRLVDVWPAAAADGRVAALDKVFHQGKPLLMGEHAWQLPGGEMRPFDIELQPLRRGEMAATAGVLLMAADVTEKVRAREDALVQENVQRQLAAAKSEAERANEAKSMFLAAASHDLRQPLQALGLYLEVLHNKLGDEHAVVMEKIQRCLCSLTEFLDDLLDLSKLDAGVVQPVPCRFTLGKVLEKVVTTHGPDADKKGIHLRAVATRQMVKTDPVLFERILSNLVSNAVRYTDKGGVVVGCRRRRGRKWVEVWDSGIGIGQQDIPEIFEEFKQLRNPERSRDKGTGLGLAIVRRAAMLLGAEIRVESKPGRGSVFAVALPDNA